MDEVKQQPFLFWLIKLSKLYQHSPLQVEPSETGEKVMTFFKLRPEVVSPDNIHSDVLTLSMMGSPSSALFQAIDKVGCRLQ